MPKKSTLVFIILATILIGGTYAPLISAPSDRYNQNSALTELRYEIADLKHALNNTQVELQILEEQIKKNKTLSSSSDLDRKIHQLEELQRKTAEEIKLLSKQFSQAGTSIGEHQSKITQLEKTIQQQQNMIGDITQIKSNLASIAHSLQIESEKHDLYRVQPGDSLEKIARMHKVSVKQIKDANNLLNDKIKIGQELTIPYPE